MTHESWRSRSGFILAAAGSAIGLANIWRFPYIVGENGGAAFILLYLLCLLVVGFPLFVGEILIGRSAQKAPPEAFHRLARWKAVGMMTIITGFIVSAFYSAVAGWILGYLYQALQGTLTTLSTAQAAKVHFNSLTSDPYWTIGWHGAFLLSCTLVLLCGVKGGIERASKIMMPLLFALLTGLAIWGLFGPGRDAALAFLFNPDFSALTPEAYLMALGQAFFTLSLGQGTMITYGSYLSKGSNLSRLALPVVAADTAVSLLAAIAVMTTVFGAGLAPDSGPGLLFQTLPIAFGHLPGGALLGILFFLLVAIAALTSEISALEPTIAHLTSERGWSRRTATLATASGAFLVGIPCALSFGILSDVKVFDMTFFDLLSEACTQLLIPLGALAAALAVGWRWKRSDLLEELASDAPWLRRYLLIAIQYVAPVVIIVIMLHGLGLFQ